MHTAPEHHSGNVSAHPRSAESFSSSLNALMLAGALVPFSAAQVPAAPPPAIDLAAPSLDRCFLEAPVQTVDSKILLANSLRYFVEARTSSGLILDRMHNEAAAESPRSSMPNVASLAATGYGLSTLPLMVEHGLITREEARSQFRTTLATVEKMSVDAPGGWLYHFVDPVTLQPAINSEISTIDTALFYFGAIVAAEFLEGPERDQLYRLLKKVDFDMMLTDAGTKPESQTFSHGLKVNAESGEMSFIPARWDAYSEGILLPFLALGVAEVTPSIWSTAIDRKMNWNNGADITTFENLPLFTYFYPLGYIPCKDQIDCTNTDYWQEAADAVALQLAFSKQNNLPESMFGFSACDGPKGYRAFTAKNDGDGFIIAPPAIAAALAFSETASTNALREADRLSLLQGRYGMVAAFDPATGWTAPDMLGIDVGSTALMLDSYHAGTIHRLLEKSPVIQTALKRCGFKQRSLGEAPLSSVADAAVNR